MNSGRMRAWRVSAYGEPADVLRLDEVDRPIPGAGQVLVRVRASALNFPDALMCRGTYQVRPELPFTPGIELCGEVVEAGAGATWVNRGDRVSGMSVPGHGALGDFALMKQEDVRLAPSELDDAEAAAFYVAYQTGWFGLHRRAHLQPGETLLVHAAAGGVGSAAVELGLAAGATVIGVVGGPEKAEVVRRLGADLVIDRREEDFVSVVNEFTDGRGADVIYDPVGGDTYHRSTKCVAFEGRIVVVGFAGGEIQSVGLNHALVKNYSIVGLHWGLYEKRDPDLTSEAHDALCQLVSEGRVRPVVSERLGLDDVSAGVQRLADGRTIGRVVYVAE